MNKKTLVYTAIAMTSLGIGSVLGAVGLNKVYAESDSDSAYSNIVQNIAAKFGLNEADVQQVFEDTREQEYESRLDEAVSDGDITEEQKALIITKHDEVETKMEDINNQELTADERRNAMDDLRDELKAWADENDIPARYLMFGGKGRHHGGDMGMREMM